VPAGADQIADKKAEAQRIASQLDAQSNRLADLAEQFNEARLQSEKVSAQAAAAQAEVARLQAQVDDNRQAVRGQAVAAYVRGGISPSANMDTTDLDPSRMEQYVSSIIGQRQDALDALRAAQAALAERQSALDAAKARARGAVARVNSSKLAAASAQASQRATLSKVQGELAGLVAAEAQRRAAEQARKAQAALAARQARDSTAARSAPRPAGSSAKPVKGAPAEPSGPPPGPPASGASAAVAKAKEQIGKPYEWGAAGPNSFDCSGLTMYAWRAGGRSLPHSSRAQWSATTRVSVSAVQPGDILFYGSPIHHVGIYVGGGQMVEAPETGEYVRYASIYRSDLVGAGRVY
jgi:cell wall-associated NlpC family hydrolase